MRKLKIFTDKKFVREKRNNNGEGDEQGQCLDRRKLLLPRHFFLHSSSSSSFNFNFDRRLERGGKRESSEYYILFLHMQKWKTNWLTSYITPERKVTRDLGVSETESLDTYAQSKKEISLYLFFFASNFDLFFSLSSHILLVSQLRYDTNRVRMKEF